ncbi:hypothetical protein [Streptomyces sp. NPDC051173]|uniref:hypothetical protein n=1 Tax=Streptomyces sp. NPDC051173 TaxID=3155164 RepID=UPI00344EE3A4
MNGIDSVKATRRLGGLIAVGALALTGCGPDSSPAHPASSASAAKPSTSGGDSATSGPNWPNSAPTGTADSGGSGSDAKAGDNLKLGQAAKIPFTYGSTKGEISLAVTSIDQGDPADLASLNLGDQVKGKVPYYIRYSVTNAGTSDLSFSSVNHMKGHLPDGTEAQDLMVIGDFDKCKSDALPSGFTAGKTAQGCAVALAPSPSVKVTSAEYWGEPFTLGKGVLWK